MRDDRFDYDGFEQDPDILDILPEDDIEIPGVRDNPSAWDDEYDSQDEDAGYGRRSDSSSWDDEYDFQGENDEYGQQSDPSAWDDDFVSKYEDGELGEEPLAWEGEDGRQEGKASQAGYSGLQVEEIRWKEAAVKPPKLKTRPDQARTAASAKDNPKGKSSKKGSKGKSYEGNPDGNTYGDDSEGEPYEDGYEEDGRTARSRGGAPSRFLSFVLIAVVVAAALIGVLLLAGRRQYDSYRVVRTERLEDTVTSSYDNVGGGILQYSADNARLQDRQGREIWSMSYALKGPKLVKNGSTLVLYDQGSTGVVVAGKDGKLGAFSTKLPIVKASVSRQGNVAAILEDGNNAWIEYYAPDGSEIAAIKTSMDNPGYPMALAVSPNGELLAVSYLNFTGGIQKSEVYIYSFGAAGKNQMDNRIAAFTYDQRIIPELAYLNDGTCVAFRDNGYSLIEGTKVPKISRDVEVEREICSIFYDSEHIGMILVGNEEGSYRMRVSNASGGEILDQAFDFPFSSVEIYGSEISLYNGSAFEVYNMSGTRIFSGSYAGDTKHLFTVGKQRYVAVTDTGFDLIELS